jgi:hypothetical protein
LLNETIPAAANRLGITQGAVVQCDDGVRRKVKQITPEGIRVAGTRTLVDPRRLQRKLSV